MQSCHLTGTARHLPVTNWLSLYVLLARRAVSERDDAREGHGQCQGKTPAPANLGTDFATWLAMPVHAGSAVTFKRALCRRQERSGFRSVVFVIIWYPGEEIPGTRSDSFLCQPCKSSALFNAISCLLNL